MSEKRLDEILAAALALFSRKGYQKTSLTEVAEAVGITKGGIYHYIDKKEDLLFLIHKQMLNAFLRSFQISSEIDGDPKSRLFSWIYAHLILMRDYRSHIKIFFNELYSLERKSDLENIIRSRDEIYRMLYEIIKEGMQQKQFRNDINPKILTFLLFGMLNWFYQWYRPDGPRTLEKIYDDVIKLVSGGVLKNCDSQNPATR